MLKIVCVVLLLALSKNCDPVTVTQTGTIRQTTNGPVEGIEVTSSLSQMYYAFRGVPFAEAPITGMDPHTGQQVDRRFKAPEELKRTWTNNLKVQTFGDFCIVEPVDIQVNVNVDIPFIPKYSEDCLFMNIYVPAGGSDKKTVLVWIHGGKFAYGDAGNFTQGPDFLLAEDNIVITIQSRLGVFGFMNFGFDEYTGNMGLKDQQMALKWIYKNIVNFSGNKDEILLFGISAGGASIHLHMLNEESRKYFNRAYLASSPALSSQSLSRDNHIERMKKCLKVDDKEKLIEALKTADCNIVLNCRLLSNDDIAWLPTIENSVTKGAFLTQTPEEIYNSNNAPIMDTMFTFSSNEAACFQPDLFSSTEPLLKGDLSQSNFKLTPYEGFNQTTYPDQYKKALELLRDAYYGDTTDVEAIRDANIGIMSDMHFVDNIIKSVEFQTLANNGTKNTFIMRFSVHAELNLMSILWNMKYKGAVHADDLCYTFHCHLFDSKNIYDEHLKSKDTVAYNVIKRMAKIITNFARTGNPSIEGDTPFQSCKSPAEFFVQEISNNNTSSVTTIIKEQSHYDTWRQIDQIFEGLIDS